MSRATPPAAQAKSQPSERCDEYVEARCKEVNKGNLALESVNVLSVASLKQALVLRENQVKSGDRVGVEERAVPGGDG